MNISQHCFVPLRMEIVTSGRQSVWYFRDSAEQGYLDYCNYIMTPIAVARQTSPSNLYRIFNNYYYPMIPEVMYLLFKISGDRYDVRVVPQMESQNRLGNTFSPDVIDDEII